MSLLKSVVLTNQRNSGFINAPSMVPNQPQTMNDFLNPKPPSLQGAQLDGKKVTFNSTTQNITDGYWIVLQEWTQCSLKCGNGTSTLQRMCVPPKDGGAPCVGEAIMTRPCN